MKLGYPGARRFVDRPCFVLPVLRLDRLVTLVGHCRAHTAKVSRMMAACFSSARAIDSGVAPSLSASAMSLVRRSSCSFPAGSLVEIELAEFSRSVLLPKIFLDTRSELRARCLRDAQWHRGIERGGLGARLRDQFRLLACGRLQLRRWKRRRAARSILIVTQVVLQVAGRRGEKDALAPALGAARSKFGAGPFQICFPENSAGDRPNAASL